MQKMERVEGQELNTTEQKTEVYTDNIQEAISNYCIDHDIDMKDIYTFDQQRCLASFRMAFLARWKSTQYLCGDIDSYRL